jgi:putative phosphoribosyl transferase
VGPADSLHVLAAQVDELVCLKIPKDFQAVGQWYEDFAQVPDEEVIRLLRLARGHETPAAGRSPAAGPTADEAREKAMCAAPGGGRGKA